MRGIENRPMDPGVLFNQTGGGGSVCSLNTEGLTATKIGDSGMGTPVAGGGSLIDSTVSPGYGGEDSWHGIDPHALMYTGDSKNRSCAIGSFQTCFEPAHTELRALIANRLGFVHGEFDVDRGELTSSYTDYDSTLVPQFTRVDGSGRILDSSVNGAGNLVLTVLSNRWLIDATPFINAASAVSVLGGEAVASLARIVSVNLAGDIAEIELKGVPDGWLECESYRLFSGYSQEEGKALSDLWSIIVDVADVQYIPALDMTAVFIEGIDGNAGAGSDFPFEPGFLNGRSLSIPGSCLPAFFIKDTSVDDVSLAITVLLNTDATDFIHSGDIFIIGARSNPYNASQNTYGGYYYDGEYCRYDNINRQYEPMTGIWNCPDPIVDNSLGNRYSYVESSYHCNIDILGLKKKTAEQLETELTVSLSIISIGGTNVNFNKMRTSWKYKIGDVPKETGGWIGYVEGKFGIKIGCLGTDKLRKSLYLHEWFHVYLDKECSMAGEYISPVTNTFALLFEVLNSDISGMTPGDLEKRYKKTEDNPLVSQKAKSGQAWDKGKNLVGFAKKCNECRSKYKDITWSGIQSLGPRCKIRFDCWCRKGTEAQLLGKSGGMTCDWEISKEKK